jgi:hypothetical protein
MLRLPFFDTLDKAQKVLVAGAGGGYDILCGLPLYFALQAAGKQVHLANLSFSYLPNPAETGEARWSPALLKVTADTPLRSDYFPELYLAQWFRSQGTDTPIYCFERTGVKSLLAGYTSLVEHLGLDTIILVDGGTDSLLRGDEIGLGTPAEDIASIIAVNELPLERKLLVCLGFGVDYFHGVCHAHFLEAVSELTQGGGYLGMFSLMTDMPEVQRYRLATEAVFKAMPWHISIVSSSILSALAGHYGDYHASPRTRGSQLWINPLMTVYWCFRLSEVARRVLYRDAMTTTADYDEVRRVIAEFHATRTQVRPWQEMRA